MAVRTLEEAKELISEILEELSEEERQELLAFVQQILYPKVSKFTEAKPGLWETIPDETEEELSVRIETFMQELDEIASDAPSDVVEDLRQIRQGK